jgi:hypothetical protein
MIWQSAKQRAASASLEASMVSELADYLEKKETCLGRQLIGSVHLLSHLPALIDQPRACLSLPEAVELFAKKVSFSLQDAKGISASEAAQTCQLVNEALWNYLEVLESCTNEFFQQLDQIGFDQWNEPFLQNATGMKELLSAHLETLLQYVVPSSSTLSALLQAYRNPSVRNKLMHKLFRRSLLDPALNAAVKKCQKFLNFRFQLFLEKYKGYMQLKQSIEVCQQQFYSFHCFLSLELSLQSRLKQLHFLLSIWSDNLSARALSRMETVRAVRGVGSPESIADLLQAYLRAIKQAVFERSRAIKVPVDDPLEGKKAIIQSTHHILADYEREIALLRHFTATYQRYIQKGQSMLSVPASQSWFRPAEPHLVKQLQSIMEACEQLSHLCAHFREALVPEKNQEIPASLTNEISRCLHEMGQPLASREWMRNHAKILLKKLAQLDEIAAVDSHLVSYVGSILCKALREDWKYHVLPYFPLFESIYKTHKNIIGTLSDKQHHKRLSGFHRVLSQLDEWVKYGECARRMQEIELDLGDIKNHLQSFYAELQAMEAAEKPWTKSLSTMREQLLEYQFLFSSFLHQLSFDNPEVRLLRRQLLFVDQYFDAIDSKLEELFQTL